MKLLNSDFIAVSLSTVIISTFSILLYFDFTKKVEASNTVKVGTISFKRHVAQRKYAAQVIWEDIKQKQPVFNNDSIRTSEDSEAVIHLKDGTEIELDDNSMIILALAKDTININFEHGSISAKRSGALIEGQNIRQVQILSKDTSISIGNSDVKISKLENQNLDLSVSKGVAIISTNFGQKTVKKDQQILISEKKEAKIYKKQLKLLSPETRSYKITKSTKASIRFSWERIRDRGKLFFEVSKNKNFKKPAIKKSTNKTSIRARLANGSWYWRLNFKSKKQKKREISEIRKIVVVKDKKLNLITPTRNKKFKYVSKLPIINLKWSKNRIASSYIINIAKNKSFTKDLKTIKTALTGISLNDLQEGKYYWRVKTKLNFRNISYDNQSSLGSFNISKNNKIDPPSLIVPGNKKNIDQIVIKNRGIIFSWKNIIESSQYKLLISDNKSFSKPVIKQLTNTNFIEIKKDLPSGKYYWKIQAITVKGRPNPFSATRNFTIESTGKLNLVSPKNKKTLKISSKTEATSIGFKWSKLKGKRKYKVELSRNKNFTQIVYKKTTLKNITSASDIKPGKYFWRVQIINKNNSIDLKSNTNTLNIVKEKEKIITKKTTLIVKTSARRSKIYINSKRTRSGKRIKATPGKVYKITVTARGYHKYSKNLILEYGEEKIFRPGLIKIKKKSREKWSTKLNGAVVSKPLYSNGILVVTTEKGEIVGLTAGGKKLWKVRSKKGFQSTPSVYKSTLYAVNSAGILYSIRIKSGAVKWKKRTMGPLLYGAKPLVLKSSIIIATSYGMIQSFSYKGNQLWMIDIEAGIFNSVTHHKGVIYIGTDSNSVHAISVKDGKSKWNLRIDSRMVYASPKIHKDTLYLGCYSGTFYAVDIKKGEIKWTFKADSSIFSSPAFLNDIIYLGSTSGSFYAINSKKAKDGVNKEIWKFPTGNKIVGEAVLANDLVYVTSGNSVYSFIPQTGKIKWKKNFSNRIKTPVSAVGKDLVLGLDNGEVVSLRNDLKVIVK